jgi:hypothetical protein
MDWIGLAIQAMFEVVCHGTAKALLPICTFGRVQTKPIAPRFGMSRPFSIYRQNGTVIVGQIYAILIGLIFWFAVGCILIGLARSV